MSITMRAMSGQQHQSDPGILDRRTLSRDYAFLAERLATGMAVLDVGSGTGALALAAAQAAPLAQITGVDPSASYVSYAQGRAPTERVRFVVGDAQALQMPDASFDRVVSLFVMNFIPDRSKALRETIRVTRPDGVVSAAVWDYGDGMQMLRVFWDEAVALELPDVALPRPDLLRGGGVRASEHRRRLIDRGERVG